MKLNRIWLGTQGDFNYKHADAHLPNLVTDGIEYFSNRPDIEPEMPQSRPCSSQDWFGSCGLVFFVDRP